MPARSDAGFRVALLGGRTTCVRPRTLYGQIVKRSAFERPIPVPFGSIPSRNVNWALIVVPAVRNGIVPPSINALKSYVKVPEQSCGGTELPFEKSDEVRNTGVARRSVSPMNGVNADPWLNHIVPSA